LGATGYKYKKKKLIAHPWTHQQNQQQIAQPNQLAAHLKTKFTNSTTSAPAGKTSNHNEIHGGTRQQNKINNQQKAK
jgi:hypothetical protein